MKIKKLMVATLFASSMTSALSDEFDWASVTLDNDLFTGSDNGYTNGLTISMFDIAEKPETIEPSLMVKPFKRLFNETTPEAVLDIFTFGQVMMTPADITLEVPPEGDVPYAGLLYLSNTYVKVYPDYSEDINTVIGIVGPASGAKRTQRFIHDLIGADEPMGWSTQLKNEVVLNATYGRTYRSWVSENESSDILTRYEGGLGNLETSAHASALFRYGTNLASSYPTIGFNTSRLSNPTAVEGGWYVYGGLTGTYTLHNIFLDGNTFEDGPSVEYDRFSAGFVAGFAYSWSELSITFSLADLDIFTDSSDDEGDSEQYNRYGSLTIAWKI
jgi:lipid A 3-O-deacylase